MITFSMIFIIPITKAAYFFSPINSTTKIQITFWKKFKT